MPPIILGQVQAAEFFAYALYAALYLLIFRNRVYYLGFCVLVLLASGPMALEYAPAFWVPVELVLGMYAFFTKIRQHSLSRRGMR